MQIYNHDTPEAIAFKNNSIELDNWIEHLNYIEKEIINLLNLGNTELSKVFESKNVIEKLAREKETNTAAIDAFLKYKEGLPKAAECEDVDCDMFYVTEHEKFRKTYLAHLKRYREVKEEYFSMLSK
ncbi:hypothetical protein [Aequorivita vladivostokensis]|jgi:hypothetical protein|uniref:Uncharacterized protein n=1 Tax=Aequorivita vladivostokensis TaxID=171194 RepID=A0ABR5DMA2_9FLAO|nr:hypothetical protein [Aequorivita vladivostokensis]MAB56919.1 hypothetical protein [Aequorivita sp.]HAI19755.1 hypothetical protein [Xanthomarina gelatinilytica]KJJ39907.1 hypothetical protein MB09_01740 [Aequorivita vladivostokensis]MBF30910.1 hypothetical protein [Aequorivita sp.]HAV54043.1 hypothetical protein [Aequorivita sp.]|tara:strand:- start:54183 stop:54563 length:381 start_codon:yes stop_codon:yes gene_type:complete